MAEMIEPNNVLPVVCGCSKKASTYIQKGFNYSGPVPSFSLHSKTLYSLILCLKVYSPTRPKLRDQHEKITEVNQ